MQWGIGSTCNSHSKIELSEKYEKLIIFFFIVCPWKTSLSNYACAVAYFLCCSAAFVWARCLHEGNRSSKAVNTSQLHLMKALASLKKQSPLPRDLTIVAFKKENNANNICSQATNTCRRTCQYDQEGRTGPGESLFLVPPAPAGGSQLTGSRQSLEEILYQMLWGAAGLSKGGTCNQVDQQKRKLEIFAFHLASSCLYIKK